jgi:hypothetical protein
MPAKRRKFERPLGERRYLKLFVIAVEGYKTEPQYFALINQINQRQAVIQVQCLKHKQKNSPIHVLNRMKQYIKNEKLKATDEAWLVVDKDEWTDEQLIKLHDWAKAFDNYGFALSNPKFEYWLLLHFEDGDAIVSSQNCSERLKRYLPEYDKGIEARKITLEHVRNAVNRAKQRDNPPCADWPREIGGTTVYKLVENIIGN